MAGFGGRGVDGSPRAHHKTECGQPMVIIYPQISSICFAIINLIKLLFFATFNYQSWPSGTIDFHYSHFLITFHKNFFNLILIEQIFKFISETFDFNYFPIECLIKKILVFNNNSEKVD